MHARRSRPGWVGAAAWDRLARGLPQNPFVRHAFLSALHETGCASARTGWEPHYLTLWRNDELCAGVPLYRKHHSYGEYVFDWAWAEAHQRHGIEYYPKWLVAVPFTPVPGPRLLAIDADVVVAPRARYSNMHRRRPVVAARAVSHRG